MSFLVYAINPKTFNGQIEVIKVTQTEHEATDLLNSIIMDLIIDINGKMHIPNAFVDSVDVIKNIDLIDGYYVVRKDNRYTVYNRITIKKNVGWIYDAFTETIDVVENITYYIVSISGDEISDLTNSLMKSNILEPNNEITNINSIKDGQKEEIKKTEIKEEIKYYVCHKLVDGKQCYNQSTLCNGYCDIHQPEDEKVITSEKSLHTVYVIEIISKFIKLNEKTSERLNKIKYLKPNFDFIVINKWFVDDSQPFKRAVIAKLTVFNNTMTDEEKLVFNPQKYLDYFNDTDSTLLSEIDVKELESFVNTL